MKVHSPIPNWRKIAAAGTLGCVLIALIIGGLTLWSVRRGMKYGASTPPDAIYLDRVAIEPGRVLLAGSTMYESDTFKNVRSEIVDGTLQVELFYALGQGGSEKFDLEIPTPGQTVREVVVVGNGERAPASTRMAPRDNFTTPTAP